jgi:hypothetical protein
MVLMSQDHDSRDQLADAVRAVLAAARAWRDATTTLSVTFDPCLGPLYDAVDALDAALADAGPRVMPDTPWREVLAGDEAYSPKTDRWYKVLRVFAAVVELDIDGTPRQYRKPDETVTVRRPAGPEADAVAVLQAAGFDLATLAGSL